MKVNKSGTCHNLVPAWANPLGEFPRQPLILELVFHVIFEYFVYIAHLTKFTRGSSFLGVVNDLATNSHTGLMYIILFSYSLITPISKSSAAALLGWNSLALALSVSPLLRSGLFQVNSRGYSSCSGLSVCVFSALSCTLLSLHFDLESGVPPHLSSICLCYAPLPW